MNYIILNGKKSTEINGLMIQKLPAITKPPVRNNIETIDGRDGDIVTVLGYGAYDKTFEIGLYGDFDINEIIAYFNSAGTVTFSNEDDKYYNYQILEQINFERLIRFRTATVTMHVQPFKYSLVDQTKTYNFNSNLLNFTNWTKTTNGITVTVADGVFTVSGTGSTTTEFYVPIPTLSLEPGDYIFNAYASGTAPNSSSLRLINDIPSDANSFGGTYITLKNNATVSLNTTLNRAKTYNYIWFYISGNVGMDFTINFTLINTSKKTMSVFNNGNIIAKPIITIYGEDTINLQLNGYQLFVINLGAEGNITINISEMEAYKDGILKNRLVTGNYENFVLNPGPNTISVTGDVSQVEISNFSRWI